VELDGLARREPQRSIAVCSSKLINGQVLLRCASATGHLASHHEQALPTLVLRFPILPRIPVLATIRKGKPG